MAQRVANRTTHWIYRLVGSLAAEIDHLPDEEKAEIALLFSRLAYRYGSSYPFKPQVGASSFTTQNSQGDTDPHHPPEPDLFSVALFPEENPNPVLRISLDDVILYANRASQPLLREWGSLVGGPANPFWQDIVAKVRQTGQRRLVMTGCGDKTYSFDVVPILNAGYINLYGRDISDLLQVEEKARYRARLTEAQHLLLDQREQERIQIARDLHDGPLQELIAATYAIQNIISNGPEEMKGPLQEVRASLQSQVQEMRAYASLLRPPTLHKLGLEKTIRSHIDEFKQKHPEIRIRLEMKQTDSLLPKPIRLAFFRIYQEATNNIVRHSQASQVTVRFVNTPAEISLMIEDNGVGFNPPDSLFELASQGHLGLLGIQERAEAIGGHLQVTSSPGGGTRVRVSLPVSKEVQIRTE